MRSRPCVAKMQPLPVCQPQNTRRKPTACAALKHIHRLSPSIARKTFELKNLNSLSFSANSFPARRSINKIGTGPAHTLQTNSMRLHLEEHTIASCPAAPTQESTASADVYATRTRDAWRHLLNHLRALRLCARATEIEGGRVALHTRFARSRRALQKTCPTACTRRCGRWCWRVRPRRRRRCRHGSVPAHDTRQNLLCLENDPRCVPTATLTKLCVRAVNSIVRAVMRKGILTRGGRESRKTAREAPGAVVFQHHDRLEQLIAALVDLCAYRDNAESGPLLCLFWIGLQEFAYRTFRAWETWSRARRAEHWLRMLHAYAADRGWTTKASCARCSIVPSRCGDEQSFVARVRTLH